MSRVLTPTAAWSLWLLNVQITWEALNDCQKEQDSSAYLSWSQAHHEPHPLDANILASASALGYSRATQNTKNVEKKEPRGRGG